MRKLLLALGAVAVVAAIGYAGRRYAVLEIYGLAVGTVPLSDPVDEGPGVEWFDDYFTVEWLDPSTAAIGEPRFSQANYNYLILGETRALLFDTGPGVRDITPVVESLTGLPVTAVPSHLHFDHIGNHERFERIAYVDLPYLRERAREGVLRPTRYESLGFADGVAPVELRISEWWKPGETVDLGGRRVEVIHTPGHTRDSISLWDGARRQLFTGDFITEGAVYAFLPGSSLGDYRRTAETLLEMLPAGDVALLTAHRSSPPGAPRMTRADLEDLLAVLRGIREGTRRGEGAYPRIYPVNAEFELWADPRDDAS